jgi:hypothetical protein
MACFPQAASNDAWLALDFNSRFGRSLISLGFRSGSTIWMAKRRPEVNASSPNERGLNRQKKTV